MVIIVYKILVADDEKVIRSGIKNVIPWESMNVDCVLEAKNGLEALEIYNQEHPDIVITDVKMPFMTGIELSKKIRMISDRTKIIFISGYSDLDFLKSAFRDHVLNYILKPINKEELVHTVEEAIRLCEKENREKSTMLELQSIMKKSIALYRKEFFDRLIFSDTPIREIQPLFPICDFPFTEQGSFLAAIFSVGRLEEAGSRLDDYSIATGIEYLVSQSIPAKYQGYVFAKNTKLIIAVIPLGDAERIDDLLFEKIRDQISDRFPVDCIVGVGTCIDSVFEIRESYQYAKLALTRQFYSGKNKVYYSRDISASDPSLSVEKNTIQTFCESILHHDKAGLSRAVKAIMDPVKRSDPLDIEYSYGVCYLVVSRVLYSISTELNFPFWDFLVHYKNLIYQCKSVGDIEAFLMNLPEHVEQIRTETSMDQNDKYVSGIMSIIARDFKEDITIQSISNELFLTPAYICSIFKKKTSKTIHEYLTEIRIEKAKELLAASDYPIYQVATMVGYKDVKYFRKIFQQLTGYAPSQYKEKSRPIGE